MGGREREGGKRERGGGRKSNRCVNVFLLECTVYHKTHTHTTWSPQLIILGFFLSRLPRATAIQLHSATRGLYMLGSSSG